MASPDVVDANNGGEHAIEDLNDQELQEPLKEARALENQNLG